MLHTIDVNFLGTENSIACYLLESEDGPILFETGPHSTYTTLIEKIKAIGVNPSDIKHVFITHIHLDHAGAAWAFAEKGAIIYLHPFGFDHMNDPSKLMSSAKRIYQDKMDMLWGQMNPIPMEQLRPTQHGEKIKIGNTEIISWFTPGHAVHHIAWQIGRKLIAGDVAGVKIKKGIVVPPCPPPDINVEDWVDSINLIRGLDLDEVYLTHFGGIQNINEHLDQLKFILHDWANWMKPHFDKGTPPKEVTPLFVKYVKNQLIEGGIDNKGTAQYEAANPSWMSVAGLMRYWKKKVPTND